MNYRNNSENRKFKGTHIIYHGNKARINKTKYMKCEITESYRNIHDHFKPISFRFSQTLNHAPYTESYQDWSLMQNKIHVLRQEYAF